MASNKIIIYQIFTRLYGNRNTTRQENGSIAENGCGKMNDFTPSVKGKAGSPYAITDYYDVDPDLATDVDQRMQEFEQLIERTHKAGMKVIIDFVPNHVARQYHSICKPAGVKDLGETDNPQNGFDPQNNFYYCPGQRFTPYFDLYHGEQEPYIEEPAKATGNDCFHNAPGSNDWYETVKLNYGLDYYAGRVGHFNPIPDTWSKMTDILLFWAKKGIDGFRCDMAEMVPAAFWQWATDKVKYAYPQTIFIGEVYNPAEYRNYLAAGFDYLYDKVGMYDTLREVMRGNQSTHAITGAWQATDDIRDHMLYFLENHDEQRIASSFFAGDARKGVPGLVVSALLQQNPLMVYFGQEYGERGMDKEGFSGNDGRTTIFDYWSVDTIVRAAQRKLTAQEKQLKTIYDKIINIAANEKAVTDGVCFDLMYVNGQYNHEYAFIRKAGAEVLLVVANFTESNQTISITIPGHAFDFLNLKEKNVQATDLLSGGKQKLSLKRDASVAVYVEGYCAVVLKFKA